MNTHHPWSGLPTDRGRAPRLFDLLRSEIIATRLMPGQALSEKEIAARYGVSRQPVREAFIKLGDIGLLQIVPSKGSYVSKISMRRVLSAQYVREVIECALVEAAAQRATSAQQALIQACIAEQQKAIAKVDPTLFNQLDEQFHSIITEIADCQYAVQIIEDARIETDRVRRLAVPQAASRLQFVLGQHQAIANAVIAKNPSGAVKAMRVHLREIVKTLPTFARDNPDYFQDSDLRDGVGSQMLRESMQ